MNTPLFKVGERVGLGSKRLSQHNGEYIVHEVICQRDIYVCRLTGKKIIKTDGNFSYLMTEPLPELDGMEAHFLESSLRKLHKPSQFSFDELMQELKTTNKIEV